MTEYPNLPDPVMYVTYEVKVCDQEYSYNANYATATTTIQVPRSALSMINPGTIFDGMLKAALKKFDIACRENAEGDPDDTK